MNTHEGYSKKKLDNDNVLLAGGGEKSLADFLGGIRISSSKIQYKAADSAASWTDLITLVNTDENVKQTPKTDNTNRPLMMINGGTSTGTLTSTSMFSTGIYANASTKMITASGFIKTGSDSSHVLLGDGGHKALSDFSMAHSHPYLPLAGGWMDDGAQIYFRGKGGVTSPYASIGFRSSVTGKMHADNTYQTDGAFYIFSNGYNGANDSGGLAIDNEGVTVFGAGDAANNFTGVFRVINEDNVAAGPMFLVTKGGRGTFAENCYATHFYESSDIRLKHDISPISQSIRKFRFNDDNKLYYGFIAQELEELHPELVDNSGEYKTVNYNSAICYYIAELENKVQKLEDEINKLKNK